MADKVVKLVSSRGFQDVGTIGQTTAQLSGNIQSINAVIDVGLRNTRNIGDSFVRVQDLVDMGFGTLDGNQFFVTPISGGSSTVNVQYSVSGDGSSGSPLQLVNDTATPGNNKFYGTDGAGVRGWFTIGAGSSPLTTKGDLFGFDTADNRIPVGSNGQVLTADSTQALGVKWDTPAGGVALPGTIPDLVTWFATDNILAQAGALQFSVFDRTPWRQGARMTNTSSTTVISAAQLNGLNAITFAGSNGYTLDTPFKLAHGTTYFLVAKPANPATNQAVTGSSVGGGGGNSLYLTTGSGAHIALVEPFIAVIATSTATWVAGTWFQANVTYDPSTGAFAFRQSSAAANSGVSGTTGAGTTNKQDLFANDNASQFLTAGVEIAEFIAYDRVLTGPEIASIEAYLLAKWGV